ncbi:MAG: hypothetical protein ACFFD8_06055 [Candidatus Thorarchaeota archaeon]
MADEGTASTLVLVGAILQIFTMIAWFYLAYTSYLGYMLFEMMFPGMGIFMLPMLIYFAIGGILGLIFLIIWFMWRSAPSSHRGGLIVTGIIAMIFSGGIGGLLVLIGGAIAPQEAV